VRRLATWCLLLGSWCAAVSADAQAAPTFSWQAEGLTCLQPEHARSALTRLLGPSAKRAQVRVTIGRTALEEYEARVVFGDAAEHGERVLTARSCALLSDAVLLVIATALDPVLLGERLGGVAEPNAHTSRAPRHKFSLGLGALADFATLPAPALGLFVRAQITGKTLRFASELLALLPRTTERANREPGARVLLLAGSLQGCFDGLRRGYFALSPCAVAELGVMRGRGVGEGVLQAHEARALWAAAVGRIALRVVGSAAFTPELDLDLGRPVTRPYFDLAEYGQLFRPRPWLVRLGLSSSF
jgi:hypothetical protein